MASYLPISLRNQLQGQEEAVWWILSQTAWMNDGYGCGAVWWILSQTAWMNDGYGGGAVWWILSQTAWMNDG